VQMQMKVSVLCSRIVLGCVGPAAERLMLRYGLTDDFSTISLGLRA
jgi:hypothetical protein